MRIVGYDFTDYSRKYEQNSKFAKLLLFKEKLERFLMSPTKTHSLKIFSKEYSAKDKP